MKSFIEIRAEEQQSISSTINRFALATASFCAIWLIPYLVLKLYFPLLFISITGLLFLFVLYLNNHKHFILSRLLLLFSSNLSMVVFSLYMGFDTGIYLYIFMAPQLIFLLFPVEQKVFTYSSMGLFFASFLVLYLLEKIDFHFSYQLNNSSKALVYNFNFFLSLVLSFILVNIFAKKNEANIAMLSHMNMELQEGQKQLKIEIHQKEILLSEVHHRVKNNLAIISALLELENSYEKESKITDRLKNTKSRIKSIALLHEKLYKHPELAHIDIQSYINELINFIRLSYTTTGQEITFQTEMEPIELPMDTAIPFSLFVNELITNSYKHGFKKVNNGKITILMRSEKDRYYFEYNDNGIGYDVEKVCTDDSIGMRLISALVEQIEGRMIDFSNYNVGCRIIMEFLKKS